MGWNLVNRLENQAHEIIVLDNLLNGGNRPLNANVDYVNKCCSQIGSLDNFCADVVIHLGEYSRVQQSWEEPLKAMTNITSTLPYVLDYCRRHKSKLVYAGSSTKFSISPSPYRLGKSINTSLVKEYCEMFGLNYAITYFYNVYGDMECADGYYSTVVAKFLAAKDKGEKVEIIGSGNQRRNFTHIYDIVRGIEIVTLAGKGDGYMLGCHTPYSINELAAMIGVKYKHVPDVAGNRQSAPIETGKAAMLGWKASLKLEEYIHSKVVLPQILGVRK